MLCCMSLGIFGCETNDIIEEGDKITYQYTYTLKDGTTIETGETTEIIMEKSPFINKQNGDEITWERGPLSWYDENLQQYFPANFFPETYKKNDELVLNGFGKVKVIKVNGEWENKEYLLDLNAPETYQKIKYHYVVTRIEKK